MLPDFVAKASEVANKVVGPKDGVMNLFVSKDELYIGIPTGWDGEVRKDPTNGNEKCPYLKLYVCKCKYDRNTQTFEQQGKPVTMKASGQFLAPYGVITAADVERIISEGYVYAIQTKSGGTITVNNRPIEIVQCDAFIKVGDDMRRA